MTRRSFLIVFAAMVVGPLSIVGDAYGDGVAQVMTSKSIPQATVEVVDPESGTSSGGGSTDVKIAAGDIILFRFNYFSVPSGVIHGLQGYLTEYVPANTEIVGVRIVDENGLTVEPRYPGISNYGCPSGSCNGWDGVACSSSSDPSVGTSCSGGTRDLLDGSISQLYADTGIFYATDADLERDPGTEFIRLTNGIVMSPEPTRANDIDDLLGAGDTLYAHNAWDWRMVRGFGTKDSPNNGSGNTPYLYGSPVAGPDTYYKYVVSEPSPGTLEYNDQVGPWNRVQYPGSLIGYGNAATGSEQLERRVQDSTAGHDLKPANPLPSGTAAMRAALGEVRVGEPGALEVALRVLDTPLDPVQGEDVDCGEVHGGDTAAKSRNTRAKDNPWGIYLASPACVRLNLKFDLDVSQDLAVVGDHLDYTISGKNLSTLSRTSSEVKFKYDSSRQALVSTSLTPDSMVSDCDGDGLQCLFWNLGTLDPSEEFSIGVTLEVGGGGHVTNVDFAEFSSDDLPGGFETQALTIVKGVSKPDATLGVSPSGDFAAPTSSSADTVTLTGTIENSGTASASYDTVTFILPPGWSFASDVSLDGTPMGCSGLSTNEATCTVGESLAAGTTRNVSFDANVPAGTADGLYDVGVQLWTSQSGFGGNFETYFPDLATVPVGAERSDPPVVQCNLDPSDPILSTETEIEGTTSEGDGTTVRLYFNRIERGTGTSSGTDWTIGTYGEGTSFGTLYGGLEVRATAQAPGELESELSAPCFVESARECSDNIDNDGDGLIDFPEDDGCTSVSDRDESDPPECNDGTDNDADGDVDFPDDLECDSPSDDDENGPPACNDGVDNDGDGLVDSGEDPECDSSTDRTEVALAACQDGQDNDSDGFVDFPDDPGCHSEFDDIELDPAVTSGDIRARMMVVFDTSGSMNWNTCTDDSFTGGDGSVECTGNDVACTDCMASGCGNSTADDSRLFKAKEGMADAISGYGEVEYSLMRFHQRAMEFSCPGPNASLQSGGWQGSRVDCSGGFNSGDLLVDFSQENQLDMLAWMDHEDSYPYFPPPAGFDRELRGTGTTPLAGSLDSARNHLETVSGSDAVAECRPYRVILLTDGIETCGGDPVRAAGDLDAAGYPVHVVGFAVNDAADQANLDDIASAGGTGSAIFVDNETELAAEMSDIVSDTVLTETCNGVDDDCDTFVDEGFTLYCDVHGVDGPATTDKELCTDPGETVCDGQDDNCNGQIDEGLLNDCGECGDTPTETCDGLDNDCDAVIDEGDVCGDCVPEAEICDNKDNDCDGFFDEGVTRECGTDVGECTTGTQTCDSGTWDTCTGDGPTTEICDNLDNDCDGQVDGISRECGPSTGACEPGTETCTGGTWGSCTGAIGPSGETCDGIDDDCDGTVDEGTGGGSCGSSIGECDTGTFDCVSGSLTCTGNTGPSAEDCDGLDDDCDGITDEEVPTMGSCGTCGEGVLTCEGGSFVCKDDRAPSMELCDGIDNDCDGETDEGNPGGGSECGTTTGACEAGSTECVSGSLECTGGVSAEDELCDTVDNDCDGKVDEGNPEGGGSCNDVDGDGTDDFATETGECESGAFACSDGSLVCVGATGPNAELCDGLDNDCDGSVDEGNPESGEPCGDDEGACEPGTTSCVDGELICDGAVGPSEEECNGEDDDCDGTIDDGIPVGAPCGTDVGECTPGNKVCVDGDTVCEGGIKSSDEVCDALDNDCDGTVDEDLPLGGECGMAEGLCQPGMLQCMGGMEVCVDAVPKEPETCDCDDNDCDGAVDEKPESGTLCPEGSACVMCQCAVPCGPGEFKCASGRVVTMIDGECYCVEDTCEEESCAEMMVDRDGEVRCAPDDPEVPECTCKNGGCTFPCDGVVCSGGTVCNPDTGRCVEPNCRGLGCPTGQYCDVEILECVDDPCVDAGCADGEACRVVDGEAMCETSCADRDCAEGETCEHGECVADPCADADCAAGQVCDLESGDCVDDACATVRCPKGTVCDPVEGTCPPDPCTTLHCPEDQHCERGECVADPATPDGGVADAGGVDAGSGRDSGPMARDAGADAGGRTHILATGRGGCGCIVAGGRTATGTRAGAALLLLGLIAGVVLRRSRRRRRS